MTHLPRLRRSCTLLVALVVAMSGTLVATAPSASAARGTSVTAMTNQGKARTAELVFIRGRVTSGRDGAGGARVALATRRPGGKWSRVRTGRTGPKGWVVFQHRPLGKRHYRLRVIRTDRYQGSRSPVVRVQRKAGARSYASRRVALARHLGGSRGGTSTTRKFGRTVRYGDYSRGVLAKLGKNTSLVRGRVLNHYRKNGGVRGRLGAPLSDQNCQLLGGGCIQRFQRGAIYVNAHAPKKAVVVRARRPWKAAYRAVAWSQVGYTEPSRRNSKYNHWMGNSYAWCGFFQAWVSRASGNGDRFPKANHFRGQIRKARARGPVRHRPSVGATAFFDYYGRGRPGHVALVIKVRRDGLLVTLDGNTTTASGARGVARRVQDPDNVMFYWTPRKP